MTRDNHPSKGSYLIDQIATAVTQRKMNLRGHRVSIECFTLLLLLCQWNIQCVVIILLVVLLQIIEAMEASLL